MYINDTHILIYVIFGIIGFISGQFIDWCNKRMPEYKKVFSKDFFIPSFQNEAMLLSGRRWHLCEKF